jgi:DNA-binding transcriptional regulator YiaG
LTNPHLRTLIRRELEGTFLRLLPELAEHIASKIEQKWEATQRMPAGPVRRLLTKDKPHTPDGIKLRALREELGMTQNDLAKALLVGHNYISNLELGRKPMPAEIMAAAEKLAEEAT